MTDTRSRIIEAAVAILREGSDVRPSVRVVAARAGVGASTLRHYFPTQQALIQATLTSLYESAMPDERIRDTSVPAEQRLVECLTNLLTPAATPDQAREVWRGLFRAFIEPEPTDQTRTGYAFVFQQAMLRVESWLAVLTEEGALPAGDGELRAKYLLTVVDGISLARAMPDGGLSGPEEEAILEATVASVMQQSWPLRSS